jgi:hypothetical protein
MFDSSCLGEQAIGEASEKVSNGRAPAFEK